jgi:uncharacterized membrane protein (UPF0127 family)
MPSHLLKADGSRQPLNLSHADTWPARLKGLLGQPGLPPATGLWIRPCNSVHSLFMRFSIDLIYLNRAGQVVGLRAQLKPWRLSLCWAAHSVVELAGGECQRLAIRLGDQILCASSPS